MESQKHTINSDKMWKKIILIILFKFSYESIIINKGSVIKYTEQANKICNATQKVHIEV